MNIPRFTNTQEAISFGLANYKDAFIIADLKNGIERLKIQEYVYEDNIDELLKIAFKSQLIREAIETATGIMPAGHLQFTYKEAVQSWKKCIEQGGLR